MLPRGELVRVVASDLTFLLNEWDQQIDDDSLRRSSSVLRRLLVDNELQRAWKEAGFAKEPRVVTSTLVHVVGRLPLDIVAFATAGGGKYKDTEVLGVLIARKAMTPDEIPQRAALGSPEEPLGLRSFVESPCMVIGGSVVSRRLVIKYVSNKLGGAHFDRTRGQTYEELLFKKLDSVHTLKLVEKNAVYFELLSIGQTLARANDIRMFCDRVQARSG